MDRAEPHDAMAIVLNHLGRFDEAAHSANKAIELHRAAAADTQAQASSRSGDDIADEEQASLRSGTGSGAAVEQLLGKAYRSLADARGFEGRLPEATAAFAKAVLGTATKEDPELWYRYATSLWVPYAGALPDVGEYSRAVEAYQQALALEPTHTGALYERPFAKGQVLMAEQWQAWARHPTASSNGGDDTGQSLQQHRSSLEWGWEARDPAATQAQADALLGELQLALRHKATPPPPPTSRDHYQRGGGGSADDMYFSGGGGAVSRGGGRQYHSSVGRARRTTLEFIEATPWTAPSALPILPIAAARTSSDPAGLLIELGETHT